MKVIKNRRDKLLAELAAGFRRGACLLLDRDWLCKHAVTLMECGDLSDAIADAIDARFVAVSLLKGGVHPRLRPEQGASR